MMDSKVFVQSHDEEEFCKEVVDAHNFNYIVYCMTVVPNVGMVVSVLLHCNYLFVCS